MTNNDRRDKGTRMERHAHSLMLTASLAALTWIAGQLMSMTGAIAAIKDHMQGLEITAQAAYTTREAKRDFAELTSRIDLGEKKDELHDSEIARIETEQGALKHRVDALDKRTRAYHDNNSRAPIE